MRIVTTKHARAGAIASALLVLGGGPAAPSVENERGIIQGKIFDVKITDEGETGPRAVTNFQVFIKGADRTLIKFTDPGDKGKFLLTVEEGMWLYLPSTSRPIRVTPLQRLAGAASNGDVAQTDFAILYSGTLVGEETFNGRPVWVLELAAKRKSATYSTVRYWVAKQDLIPLQAELRVLSDKSSKLTRFEEFEEIGGRRFLKRQVIIDLLRRERRTVLEFSNYAKRDIPDRFFNKNYLGEL